MKLRIRGDSVRLRLTRAEVALFAERGLVEEETAFAPGERLVYAITLGGTELGASFTASRITVAVPAELGRAWAAGDDVGIEGAADAGGGRTLRILVEKDFACLTARSGEDDADAFPNPNVSC